jgi:uncharacterized protein YjbI with pentapeptide repeats
MSPAASPPTEPQLPDALDRGEIASLDHDARFSDVELTDISLVDQRANGVAFETVRLAQVDLSGSRLEHLRILDGALDGCNLANLQGRNASIKRAMIQSSRLTGIDFAEGALIDITFRDCRIDLASFGFARLQRVTFEDCLLAQTDFLEAQLDSVRFHGCDLTRADFRGAQLQHCELRRSDLTELEGVQSLRGAAMEWSDILGMAGVLAGAIGIEVLDTDR